MATVSVTDESFENDVLKSEKPIVVYFCAEWCGHDTEREESEAAANAQRAEHILFS